jgi:hypothetical protein
MTVQQPTNQNVEQQARFLAADNRQAEPNITKVYWFPDDGEVRLVELTDQVPVNEDNELHPFYFRASPQDSLPLPTAVVMIRPEEFGKLKLPPQWGEWADAIEL